MFAWLCIGQQAKGSLGGGQHCSHPALLLREERRCFKGHRRELGPALGCELQPRMPGSLLYLRYPRTSCTVSSCPHSAPGAEEQGQALTAFDKVSLPLVPMLESHTGIQLPLKSSLLCTSLVPWVNLIPKSSLKQRSHACILP